MGEVITDFLRLRLLDANRSSNVLRHGGKLGAKLRAPSFNLVVPGIVELVKALAARSNLQSLFALLLTESGAQPASYPVL
jgi:hypothetical protein